MFVPLFSYPLSMKKNILFCLFFLFSIQSFSQSGQWVWMKGDTIFEDSYYAPVKGIEDTSYHPPSVYLASSWKDDSGRFWMFGGTFYDIDNYNEYSFDKIWRYNPTNNSWAFIKSSNYVNSYGKYGIQGVPDINNYPSGRIGGALWKTSDQSVWLFGGSSVWGYNNDLWKYNMSTNEWTWVKGPDSWDEPGSYGIKGIPDDSNNPPTRRNAATWVDDSNNLWLFGGYQETPYEFSNFFNDLWMFNTSTNLWTWMGGTDTVDNAGVFGIKGLPDSTNLPSSRSCNCTWSDDDDNFYLFGGAGIWVEGTYMMGDVWRYNSNTKEWTWLKGSDQANIPGVQGSICEINSDNFPISRMQPTCIKLDSGRILMFGGFLKWAFGYASFSRDVWIYNFKENIWSRLWRDSSKTDGNYGTQGVYDATNDPRSRFGAMGWLNENDLWIYGGNRCVDYCSQADLWRYTLDSNCLLGVYNITEPIPIPLNPISIRPNPTQDHVTFDNLPNVGITTITILSITGSKLITTTISSANKTLNVASLPSGFYLIKIQSGNHQQFLKFIKVDQ